jgi:ankyrin repeat protein
LAAAAAGNCVSIAKQLLELGADVDLPVQDRQLTPLHIAAENGCEEMVEFLLAAGASPAARSTSETTPFYRAARGGSIRILSLLYKSGSDIDAETWDGWTPLMEAAAGRHESAVKLFLEWGADPQACTARGFTALYLASGDFMSNITSMLRAAIDNSSKERPPSEPASCPTANPAAEFDKTGGSSDSSTVPCYY